MRTIAEILSYNRRNASQLNPLLFEDDKLKPEIKEKILKIVDEFLKYAEVDIKVLDVRLVGSNAAYNYQEGSDLDIHIVTDLSKISDPESIARLYFDSVKKNFKDAYDITIKGIDVELYVEDVNTSANSNGIYSVLTDTWIKEPTPSVEPTDEQMEEAEEIEDQIIDSIKKANSVEELEDIVDKLYLLRKDSLAKDGETGAGNLAFKSLRNKGILEKIKDVLRDDKSKELSLESKDLKESSDLEVVFKDPYRTKDNFDKIARGFSGDVQVPTIHLGKMNYSTTDDVVDAIWDQASRVYSFKELDDVIEAIEEVVSSWYDYDVAIDPRGEELDNYCKLMNSALAKLDYVLGTKFMSNYKMNPDDYRE